MLNQQKETGLHFLPAPICIWWHNVICKQQWSKKEKKNNLKLMWSCFKLIMLSGQIKAVELAEPIITCWIYLITGSVGNLKSSDEMVPMIFLSWTNRTFLECSQDVRSSGVWKLLECILGVVLFLVGFWFLCLHGFMCEQLVEGKWCPPPTPWRKKGPSLKKEKYWEWVKEQRSPLWSCSNTDSVIGISCIFDFTMSWNACQMCIWLLVKYLIRHWTEIQPAANSA